MDSSVKENSDETSEKALNDDDKEEEEKIVLQFLVLLCIFKKKTMLKWEWSKSKQYFDLRNVLFKIGHNCNFFLLVISTILKV